MDFNRDPIEHDIQWNGYAERMGSIAMTFPSPGYVVLVFKGNVESKPEWDRNIHVFVAVNHSEHPDTTEDFAHAVIPHTDDYYREMSVPVTTMGVFIVHRGSYTFNADVYSNSTNPVIRQGKLVGMYYPNRF